MHIQNVEDQFLDSQSKLFFLWLFRFLVLSTAPNDFPNETAVFMGLSYCDVWIAECIPHSQVDSL